MTSQQQDAWLVIKSVRDALRQLAKNRCRNRADTYASLNPTIQRLASLSRGYDQACRRGYDGACHRLEPRIIEQARQLAQQLSQVSVGHHASQGPSNPEARDPLPTPAFLLAELQQIEAEFGGWEVLKGQRSLFVTTEPISLEGMQLGRFEIELCLYSIDLLEQEQPLRIHALDPNWANGADDVPHPHVRDRRLCTGDATNLLKQALYEGRLADYFLIVRQVLRTYNSDSPHVAIDDWDGVPCHDCGCSMNADDRYYCDGCEREFCDDCFGCCQGCSTTLCYGCLSTCRYCDDTTCESCLAIRSACEQSCCQGCLEDDLCPECYEQKELDDDETQQEKSEEDNQTIQAETNPAQPAPQEQARPALTLAGPVQPPADTTHGLDGGLDRRPAHL